ncbi:Beta-lactamase class A [Streptoalloteichus tenebrarius]|uniref:Beta-lactamase class A n=1 Tax=Streptoalloteichus tenebrarius (strain ATCC 17920 / DSM 40477 / JCM 4838 / CBS 697.72 / NBRC 16177 / NCIMB 11028 / NRRL B-12390 / A12253. 1 / ISP 5477) TaxID=1933 RepID=A0ABT1HYI6_STRSD|nr:serine hydrolase [Streptoalloteichus tenebrarius]MCP2260535.1 Beta-lactamase class A [Streptoalloteichus tenebrarius]BFF01875.1 hypothetical protein GCM10020241_35500 [Streptoalloteichus tenebrarius]
MGDTRPLLTGLVVGALVAGLATVATSQGADASGSLSIEGPGPDAPPDPEDLATAPTLVVEPTAPSPAPLPRDAGSGASAERALAAARAAAPGTALGVAVYDRRRGAFLARYGADRRFTSASLVKVLIALEALDRQRGGPSAGLADQLHQMLARSDDGIANVLWPQHGGPEIVRRVAARAGMTHTRPPKDPDRWGDTVVTAGDVVALYQYVVDEAPPAHRDLLLRALRAAPRRAADNLDQHFGIPRAAGGRPWAVKQGWACCLPDRVLHTTGLVGPGDRHIVVVLSSHPARRSQSVAAGYVTAATAALTPLLTG